MFCVNNLNNSSKVKEEINKTKLFFAERYNNHYEIPDRYWLLSLLLPDHAASILDIGPNVHVFQGLIEPQKREAYEYHSMDLQLNNLGSWAIEHVHDANSDPYPFIENSFDLIIATDSIEHIKNTDVFLNNIHRVLKPGGELLLTTPNYASMGSTLKIIQGKMFHSPIGKGIDKYCFNEHVKYFTMRDLIPYLSSFDIYPKYIITQGYRTFLPFSRDSYFKLFFVKYIYNNLIRFHHRFAPQLIIVAGKRKKRPKFIYV